MKLGSIERVSFLLNDTKDRKPENLSFYQNYFEKEFLEETEIFYHRQEVNLADNSPNEYLYKVNSH